MKTKISIPSIIHLIFVIISFVLFFGTYVVGNMDLSFLQVILPMFISPLAMLGYIFIKNVLAVLEEII